MNHDSDPFRVALEHLKDMIPAAPAGPPGAEADQKSTLPIPAEVEEAARNPKARVDQYVLVSRLGVGAMSDVWRAWDRELKRWVAIKFLQVTGSEDFLRLEREVQASVNLTHPNIAAVYGIGKRDGTPYVALQLVEGTTLAAYLECDPKLAASLVRAAALAVHHAHEAGVFHRDLKPQNIMVERLGTSEDGPFRVTVMDFGLPKETSLRRSGSESVVGTPSYMPPEQAQGEAHRVDARSDVYSLGATLYDIVTGLPPFTGVNAAEILRQVVGFEPAPPRELQPKVDADLEAIILKCLEKDPDRRYPTALALALDLERYVEGKTTQTRAPSFGDRLQKRILRHKTLSLALAAAAATVLGAAILLTARSVERGKEREAAALARQAIQGSKEAETLQRTRSSSPSQWAARFAQALGQADLAVEKVPTLAAGHYARGEVLRAEGRVREAARAFDRALAINPALEEAWYGRGICHLELYSERMSAPSLGELTGRTGGLLRTPEPQQEAEKAAAISDLGRYVVSRQIHADRSLRSPHARAALAYAEGHYERACDLAQEVIRQSPTDGRFWILKAEAEDALEEYDRAKGTLDRLISDVMPQLAEAHRLRALVLIHMGNWKDALESAGEALRLDSRSPWAYMLRGRVRGKLEDWDGAAEDLSQAIALDPGLVSATLFRARVRIHRKDLEGALEDYTRALERDPQVGWVWAARGDLRGAWQKKYPAALADLTKAIELDPNIPWVWGNRGKLRRALGDPKGALEDLTRGIALSPDEPGDAWIYIERGAVKRELGDRQGAARDLDKAIALAPGDATAYRARGCIGLESKEPRAALSDFRKALDLSPSLRTELAPLVAECERALRSP